MEPTAQRASRLRRLMPFWLFLVILFFAWQAFSFSGLPARAVSWQYDRFGLAAPSATLLLLIMLFAAPALVILATGRGSNGARNRTLMLTLAAIAAGCVLAAIGSVAMAYIGSRTGGEPRVVVLDGRTQPVIPAGPIRLEGQIRPDRIAERSVNLLLTTTTTRYAPVVVPGRRGAELQFFVATDGGVRNRAVPMSGLLRPGELPGEMRQLYERAGYRVADRHYVLYPDPAQYRWPFIVLAIKLALAALLVGIAAVIERRRLLSRA